MTTEKPFYDVAILGGGLAGLSLGIQLKQDMPELDIAIIERNPHPVPESAHKVGESLVELSTHYFANILKLKEHMKQDQLPKLGLRFFFDVDETIRNTDKRLEGGVELGARMFPHSPSFQLDRGIFENYLGERCKELGIHFFDNTKVKDITVGKKQDEHTIKAIDADDKDLVFTCKWLVDACSRMSPLKRKLDLAEDCSHKVSAAWFRIAEKIDISSFTDDTDWIGNHTGDNSRWFSTNHFMGEGYWVWFIPLSSGSTSIGIVADNNYHALEDYNTLDKAMAWLNKHEALCARHVTPHLDKLQDFKVLRNFSHNCKQVFSKDRWFLTGEAGVFLDPFYSPGSDFIAISNTFICKLIESDLNHDDFEKSSVILNMFYLNMFQNTLNIYQNQYAIFGNPKVMPIKILWDFAVYWSFTAFLFIQGKFADIDGLFAMRKHFEELGDINRRMQAFFLEWGKHDQSAAHPVYIDPFELDFLETLNAGLYADIPEEKFTEHFLNNIEGLKQLQNNIVSAACLANPGLALPESASKPGEANIFADLLNTISGKAAAEKMTS